MRALLVVVVLPVRENHSRLAERVYQLPVQAFLPESAIEALGVPVLPWASGIDVEGLDPVFFEPSLYDLGDELGPVVRADAFGAPCSPIAFCSRASTSEALMARSAWTQWHSLVHSSIRLNARSLSPRWV